MEKILVLTDFTDCAEVAAEAAIEIAKKIQSAGSDQSGGAEIRFLHITAVPMDWPSMTDPDSKMYFDITKKVRDIISKLNKLVVKCEKAGIPAKHSVGYNRDDKDITEYLEKNQIDYVVMGSEGASGLKEMFVGSHAQKIVRHSEVPVLVLKDQLDITNPHIVFVSDFEKEVIGPYKRLVEIARKINATIDLLYINTPDYMVDTWTIQDRMLGFKTHAGKYLNDVDIVDAHSFEEGIERYCENKPTSIVTMATHGRTGMARFLLGSLTEKVVNHVDMPVLSLHI